MLMLCDLPYPYLGSHWTPQAYTWHVCSRIGLCSHSPSPSIQLLPQNELQQDSDIRLDLANIQHHSPHNSHCYHSPSGDSEQSGMGPLPSTKAETMHVPSQLAQPHMEFGAVCFKNQALLPPRQKIKSILLVWWLLQMLLISYLHPWAQLAF